MAIVGIVHARLYYVEAKNQALQHVQLEKELLVYATPGNDIEYAAILCEIGRSYDAQGDIAQANSYFQNAFYYSPQLRKNVFSLVTSHFRLGQFEKASSHLPRLVSYQYPNADQALRIAIHTSLAAGQVEEAEKYCAQFLEQWPENEFIQRVLQKILKGESAEQILQLFKQS